MKHDAVKDINTTNYAKILPLTIAVAGLRGMPNIMGGIEAHCEQLMPRIKSIRPEYNLLIFARSSYKDCDCVFQGVRIKKIFSVNSKYFEALFHTLLCVVYARYKVRCNLIHIHGIGPALLTPVARALGLRVVVTHHGDDFNRDKWNFFGKTALRLGEWFALNFANTIIVVSERVSDRLRKRNNNAIIRHIPNGATILAPTIDDSCSPDVIGRFGLQKGEYILSVGRLVPEKNLHVLIDAYEASGRACPLVIVGAADHEDAYARALVARAGPRIKFLGFQKQAILADLYTNAGLFVLPSAHEGLPIAALEAAAAGCPILLSDIEANLEIGLNARNYVTVGSAMALADRLREHFASFQIDQSAVLAKFNWEEAAFRTASIYDALLVGSARQ
ncbi:D-inositol-3-phosphate glycosyltransferase [Methylobacterium iners]|uniref:D-inositol-3-phosphate glycosyltransferase n=2 Tax=Methylobacterium iners TaxID=418707 RepID=A0ABQ4S4K6_9HYPH|nr:D-inositol-3-phosphate glycosyltransferase [Methylobacterium iners]